MYENLQETNVGSCLKKKTKTEANQRKQRNSSRRRGVTMKKRRGQRMRMRGEHLVST